MVAYSPRPSPCRGLTPCVRDVPGTPSSLPSHSPPNFRNPKGRVFRGPRRLLVPLMSTSSCLSQRLSVTPATLPSPLRLRDVTPEGMVRRQKLPSLLVRDFAVTSPSGPSIPPLLPSSVLVRAVSPATGLADLGPCPHHPHPHHTPFVVPFPLSVLSLPQSISHSVGPAGATPDRRLRNSSSSVPATHPSLASGPVTPSRPDKKRLLPLHRNLTVRHVVRSEVG